MRMTQNSGSISHRITTGGLGTPPQTVCRVADAGMRSWRVTLGAPRFSDVDMVRNLLGPFLPNVILGIGPGSGGPMSVTAKIQWGSQNAQFEADVDWSLGCSFVVHGEFVQVSNNLIDVGGTVGGTIVWPAQIAPSESASPPAQPPTFTNRTNVIGPLARDSVGIPAFARRVQVIMVNGGAVNNAFPNGMVTWQDAGGLTQFRAETYNGTTLRQMADRAFTMDHPPGATRIEFTSLDAANPVTIGFIHHLDLG